MLGLIESLQICHCRSSFIALSWSSDDSNISTKAKTSTYEISRQLASYEGFDKIYVQKLRNNFLLSKFLGQLYDEYSFWFYDNILQLKDKVPHENQRKRFLLQIFYLRRASWSYCFCPNLSFRCDKNETKYSIML